MSIFNVPEEEKNKNPRLRIIIQAGLLIAGVAVAGIVAYWLAMDNLTFIVLFLGAPIGILLIHRYPFAAIIIWLILAPFLTYTKTVESRYMFWGIHRALPPATLIIIIIVDVLKIYKRRLPKLGIAEWCMIGYVFVSVLTIYLFNPNPLATFYQYYDRVIAPMFLYLVVRFSSPGQKDIQRLLPVIFFIAVSQSVFGLFSWVAPDLLPTVWDGREGRTTGSLVNPSVYGITLIFCSLILLHAAMGQRSRAMRILLFVVFAMAILFDFLSFSRAVGLGAVLVLIGIAIVYPRFATSLATTIFIVVLLFEAALLSNFSWVIDHANERLNSEESQISAFSRLPVFQAGVRMFIEKPIIGWGYGNFDRYDRQFQTQVGPFIGDTKDHASHNFFLTLVAEQGTIGFLLFMGPAFYWFRQTFKWNKDNRLAGLPASKLPILLWLSILNTIVVINFSNLRVFFGWGIWWLTLALIAAMVQPVNGDKVTN